MGNQDITITKTKTPKTRPSDEGLGFGRHFSDHMFVCEYSNNSWNKSEIKPYQSLALDPGASVLHYGQALFEGMKAFRGVDGKIRLFRPEMNWRRMQAGAERLCMKMPPMELFLKALNAIVEVDSEWVPKAANTALYLRPTLIGSEAFLGVRPAETFLFYIIASPVGGYYGEGAETVKIWVEKKYSRAARGGIGAVKAGGNYASSLLAATEAKKRGYAQVLWLDASEKKFVEEVGTMNVFFRIGDKVVTPSLAGTILPGVMRDSAIELLKKMNVKVEERAIALEEVLIAHGNGQLKEVFGTGTAASISPVGALGFDDKVVAIGEGKTGEIAAALYKKITDIQYGRAPDDMGWTTIVR